MNDCHQQRVPEQWSLPNVVVLGGVGVNADETKWSDVGDERMIDAEEESVDVEGVDCRSLEEGCEQVWNLETRSC